MEDALKLWKQRGQELEYERAENAQLRDMVTKLMIESEFYRAETSRLAGKNAELEKYAEELTTRLDVISGVIADAITGARQYAMRRKQPTGEGVRPEDQPEQLERIFPAADKDSSRDAQRTLLAPNRL